MCNDLNDRTKEVSTNKVSNTIVTNIKDKVETSKEHYHKSTNPPLPCKQCEFKARNSVELNAHKTALHFQSNLFSSSNNDVKHPRDNKSMEPFSCHKCSYKAATLTGLEAHVTFSH